MNGPANRSDKPMKKRYRNLEKTLILKNLALAREMWGELRPQVVQNLASYATDFGFSIASGELILLNNGWYVTHIGLIRLARKRRCAGIDVKPVPELSDQSVSRWAFRATVFRSSSCKGFVGYGDADPTNVSSVVRGAEMRIAETRAVNRALRKAYGIGICSVEEIGTLPNPIDKFPPQKAASHGDTGKPKVRDRLCQIIRNHELDANLVKCYATDFCGTKTLREASREQVENFVVHLADWAEKDRPGLMCQLNGYLGQKEGAA
jgi:hypothetical protein